MFSRQVLKYLYLSLSNKQDRILSLTMWGTIGHSERHQVCMWNSDGPAHSEATWHGYKTKLMYMTCDLRKLNLFMDYLWFRIFSLRYLLFVPRWDGNYILQRDLENCSSASETKHQSRLQIHISMGFIWVHPPAEFNILFPVLHADTNTHVITDIRNTVLLRET